MRLSSRNKNRRSESGIAVIIALLLISLLLVFVTANSNGLYQLRREIKLVDQRQRQHWNEVSAARTNAPAEKKEAP